MEVTFLEFKQNSTCNTCFDERADAFVSKHKIDTSQFHFYGLSIPLCDTTEMPETKLSVSKK